MKIRRYGLSFFDVFPNHAVKIFVATKTREIINRTFSDALEICASLECIHSVLGVYVISIVVLIYLYVTNSCKEIHLHYSINDN